MLSARALFLSSRAVAYHPAVVHHRRVLARFWDRVLFLSALCLVLSARALFLSARALFLSARAAASNPKA